MSPFSSLSTCFSSFLPSIVSLSFLFAGVRDTPWFSCLMCLSSKRSLSPLPAFLSDSCLQGNGEDDEERKGDSLSRCLWADESFSEGGEEFALYSETAAVDKWRQFLFCPGSGLAHDRVTVLGRTKRGEEEEEIDGEKEVEKDEEVEENRDEEEEVERSDEETVLDEKKEGGGRGRCSGKGLKEKEEEEEVELSVGVLKWCPVLEDGEGDEEREGGLCTEVS